MSELVIDVDSKVILEAHLQCAAHEMPLMDDDEVYFGPSMKEICETRLVRDEEGWCVSPRRCVGLRLSDAYAGITRTRSFCRFLRSISPSEVARKRSTVP